MMIGFTLRQRLHTLTRKFSYLNQRHATRRGGVAVLFAICAGISAMLFLATLQLTILSEQHAKYQGAADAAALAAVSLEGSLDDAENLGRKTFMSNLSDAQQSYVTGLNVTVEGARARRSHVIYTAHTPTILSGFLPITFIDLSGSAKAGRALTRHMNVNLWLDGSASMGVAADEAGRDALRRLSKEDLDHANCAFACHLASGLKEPTYANSAERAHAHGIKLRYDIMKESVNILIDELDRASAKGLTVSFSLSRLAANYELVMPMTSDLTAVRAQVDDFQLAGPNKGNATSRFGLTLDVASNRLVPTPSDGTILRPEKVLIFVTDGMQFNWDDGSHGKINPAKCNRAKALGYTVAVIQLKYVKLTGDSAYMRYVAPFYDQLGPALQACASPNFFYHADKPNEVRAAFKDLAETLQEPNRLLE